MSSYEIPIETVHAATQAVHNALFVLSVLVLLAVGAALTRWS